MAAGTFDSSKAAAAQAAKDAEQEATQASAKKFGEAFEAKDWETALAVLDELEKKKPAMAPQLAGARLNIAIEKGESAGIVSLAEKMMGGPAGSSAPAMNQLAWNLATKVKDASPEVLAIAAQAAEKGLEKDPAKEALLDTLARIQFLQGKKDEAVKTQEKAVANAEGEKKEGLQKTLDSYKQGVLPPAKE